MARKASEEKALAPKGLIGSLGDMDAAAFEEAVKAAAQQQEVKGSASAEDIRDAMGSVRPRLERVKVKHQGTNAFLFEGDQRLVQGSDGFVGVIVAHTFHNSLFTKPFEDHEEGDRPPCYSHDGVNVADGAESPQSPGGCTTCPRNRDARSREARDAAFDRPRTGEESACSNYLSFAVALPGRDVPVHLRVTYKSFRPWAEYVQRIGTDGRFRPYEVATRFKLRNIKDGGNEYSVAEFEKLGPLPEVLREQFKRESPNYKALLQRAAQDREEPSDDAHAAAAQARNAAKAAEGQEAAL